MKKDKTWKELKQEGSPHYKTHSGGQSPHVEPIDLYKAGNLFSSFAICSIIKYAFRISTYSRETKSDEVERDIRKIIHYAELLLAEYNERTSFAQTKSAKGGPEADNDHIEAR